MPSLADLLRNDPWGAPPQTPLAKTVTDVGFDPSLGLAGAVQTYLSRLKKMQGGLAQDMLDTAADPNAEGIQRAANLLGGLGLKIANVPMALMPSAQELRDRGYQAGASPELQAVGGALGDMVNIPEPASVGTLLAGLAKTVGGVKAAASVASPLLHSMAVAPGGLGKGLGSLLADATPAEQAALKARLEAEAAQTGGQASSVSREQALNGLMGNVQPEWVGRATLEGVGPFQGYHGSPNEITGPLKASSRGAWGPGGYSSMVPSVGKMYGGNLYTTEIDGRLFNGNAWLPESARKDVLSSLKPDEAAKVADWWKEGSMLKGEDLWNIMSRKLGPVRTQEFLKAHGFDGISGNMDGHEYVTFDPAKTRITGRSH